MSQENEESYFPIPSTPEKDEDFMEFLYERATRVEQEMPDLYMKVSNLSRETLGMDDSPNGQDFKAYICPVKVKSLGEWSHPLLLTYCTSTRLKTMLYWPMDMIPLTNEERYLVWEEFVKEDSMYLSLSF
jgi:hypothetical protein